MNDAAREVLAYLDALGLDYEMVAHNAVHTLADCTEIDRRLNALTVKNYFLATRSCRDCCLMLARPQVRYAAGDISHQVGLARLGFGPENLLAEYLHSYPGAVSPLGLMFDAQQKVRLLVDSALVSETRLAFHPLDNCYTLAMSAASFFDCFLPAIRHAPTLVEVHDYVQ